MFRFLKYFAAAASMAALLALPFFVSNATSNNSLVSVIVELRDEPGAVYKARTEKSGSAVSQDQLKAYRDQLSAKQDDFLKALVARGVPAAVVTRNVRNYDGNVAAAVPLRYTLVFDGMALKLPESAIGAVRSMPQVKSVHADERLTTNLNNSVPYIRAPQVYGKSAELSPFDTLNEGYEGQGMYVSVIDTGIDWTHPMFGGDPTPPRLAVLPAGPTQAKTNQKVVYYLPLADVGVEDGFGHGTHVASTVAGFLSQTMNGTRIHGVAPQAKLMSYKVCSDIESTVSQVKAIGGCDSSNIIMALEDSVSPFTLNNALLPKPVAHVINMSLGGGGGPDNPTAIAASNAALAGAIVVAASGNSGPGEGTTGSPAAGIHVISVGATTHPGSAGSVWSTELLQASAVSQSTVGAVSPANNLPAAPGSSRLKLFAMSGSAGLPAGALAQHYVFVNATLPTWPASVSGRIALVKAVDVAATNFDIVAQAANAGAVGIIIPDDRGAVNGVATTIPAATISPADGEILIDALSSSDDNNVDPPNGAISELPIRMNPIFSDVFMGDMASFSSRGPVQGLGQIKPDVSAPGVAVLAAVPPASLLGGLAATAGEPNYYRLDGTSMASPHTAGAVTLIKQAHLDWSPDVLRTVLINTATNMRSQTGVPKTDGPDADSIIAQGGGLIDVFHAVNAKALMGVEGDGVDKPGILGSYSYGEVPVANNRISYAAPINVTIRDLSGEGGTYNLNVANNRDLQLTGINVSTSQASVNLPANGSATFAVNATFNGDQIRDVMAAKTVGTSVIFEKIQMQWFVTAVRSDNKESLRMPFFFRPGPSLPAQTTVQTLTQTAQVPAGDYGLGLAPGTSVDVPFEVSASTLQINATAEWFQRPTGSQEDIDYELLDPDGNVIASSGGPAGATESVSVRVTRGGTYTHRLHGFLNVATDVTITTNLSKGPEAPAAQTIPADFTDQQNRQVDFDGDVTLSWTPSGGEQGFEIERSSSANPEWQVIANVAANTTSFHLANLANDSYSLRVRGIHAGQIGKFVTNAGNVVSVVVEQRSRIDITSLVSYPISNISLVGGVWQQDVNLINNSAQVYVPFVDFNVIAVNSASGNVRVINSDNGGSGKGSANAALFSFSQKLGDDQLFSPAETTSSRTLRFQDSASEMFSWDVQVTAYVGTGTSSSSSSSSSSGSTQPPPASGGASGLLPLTKLTAVMRFTANPLTKTVTKQLIKLQ